MGQLKNVVRLSETDYSTLLNGGSVTKGGKTYTLDANTLYVVEDETPPSYAQRSDYASEAGRAHGADCASRDADGNNIVETYATKDDVDTELSGKANKSATVSTVGYDATNKKLTKTINGTTSDVVTASTIVTDGGGYKKPSTGIPKTDLASAVQTSLGKADTALQSHQDISGKANLASPTFTGTPKAPTAASGTNTTQIATTAFVQNAVEAESMMITAAENAHSDTAGQRIIPISKPASGDALEGMIGAVLQWTMTPDKQPSASNSSLYFQLFARSTGKLYFRRRVNGADWSFVRIVFTTDLEDYAKTSDLPGDASTSQKGLVQLSGTINSDNAKAATPAAVNDALTAFAQQAQSWINEAVAGKSKVEVSQPTSGSGGVGTKVTVDGTAYQVVSDTDPGTTNGIDYQQAPTWHQVRTQLAGKVDNSVAGANSLFSKMPTETAVPTDTTYLIRQATSGEASFWRVPFSSVWDYIHSKLTAAANTHDNMAGQRIIPISNPASGQVFAGCYGAVLQWTAYPNRQPSDGNPSWYFQLVGISDDKLYFRSRINGAAWSPVKRLAFANELPASTTYHLRLNTHVFQSGVTDTGNNYISIAALTRNSAGVETLYSAGNIVIKDATGTVCSTWTNKCYATFSGSGFNTFASYSGPFTVELQNASGTVLTSTQIVKV